MKTFSKFRVSILAAGLVLGACAHHEAHDSTQTQMSSESVKKGPSDAEIAHIVVTANAIDIKAGELAKKESKSKAVRGFAQQMITDHSGVNKQATALVQELGVTPQDNDTSRALLAQADENMKHLASVKGKQLDKDYVDHEVAYHEAVAKAVDEVLIPHAKNEKLKALIIKVRPAFAEHLAHAKALQATLNK